VEIIRKNIMPFFAFGSFSARLTLLLLPKSLSLNVQSQTSENYTNRCIKVYFGYIKVILVAPSM
jgi:hypothetical protein